MLSNWLKVTQLGDKATARSQSSYAQQLGYTAFSYIIYNLYVFFT